MSHRLVYGTVRDTARRVIHVVRVEDAILDPDEIEAIAERMRERLAFRGEVTAEVVLVQGSTKETLRLFGESYSVSKVRAAMFNAALRWVPLDLG
jgi:hypothetical protein